LYSCGNNCIEFINGASIATIIGSIIYSLYKKRETRIITFSLSKKNNIFFKENIIGKFNFLKKENNIIS
jgi:hypothetical protein